MDQSEDTSECQKDLVTKFSWKRLNIWVWTTSTMEGKWTPREKKFLDKIEYIWIGMDYYGRKTGTAFKYGRTQN